VRDGFGATSLAWWGSSLVVARYPRSGIWTVSPNGQLGVEADRLGAQHNPRVVGVAGGWILWWRYYDRAISANLDGVPLFAKRIAVAWSAGRPYARCCRRKTS
jgi:hypothetical protein